MLCPAIEYSKALDAIRSPCAAEISLDGTGDQWKRITLAFLGKELTLTSP